MMGTSQGNRARALLCVEAPPLLVSLLVGEVWFKFGSFILEAVAFLGLWWILGAGYRRGLALFRARVRALERVLD